MAGEIPRGREVYAAIDETRLGRLKAVARPVAGEIEHEAQSCLYYGTLA